MLVQMRAVLSADPEANLSPVGLHATQVIWSVSYLALQEYILGVATKFFGLSFHKLLPCITNFCFILIATADKEGTVHKIFLWHTTPMHTKREYFQQTEPSLKGINVVEIDDSYKAILERCVPASVLQKIYEDLVPFGAR